MNDAPPSSDVHLPTAATAARVKHAPPGTADVVVVGAGLGGLMTAVRLAQSGRKVAVLDAHYVAGGCATMFSRGSGEHRYAFDIGLHYVGGCGPGGRVPAVLDEVGVAVDWRPLDPDGFDELIFPDFRFRVPANEELYRERLIALFPSEKPGIDRYMRMCREVRVLGRHNAPKGLALAWEALTKGRLAAWNKGATLGTFLNSCTKDPKLRAVIAGQNGDYGLPPSRVSLMLHCGLVNHYFDGAYYPRGGGQVIADGLAARLEALGGSIHLRHPVTGVIVEGGRAVGVQYTGPHGATGEVRAPIVVSGGDLKRAVLELLPEAAAPAGLRETAAKWEMGGAIFLTCLAVKADLGALGMGACNYWEFDGYDFDALYGESQSGTIPPVRGCYITSATRKDLGTPGHAPPGVETVEIMALVPGAAKLWGVSEAEARTPNYRRSPEYLATKARIEDNLVGRLERLFPGATANVLHRESASPVSQTRFTWASGGSGYGLACTPEQFLGNRPGYRSGVPGLYFTGANTRSGHGISGALGSGVQAARAVEADVKAG
ncbi:phytoene dehydrogenase [Deltaproteobacteria bacterium]|nr:phytoene dehydrogenase [Deltaproteobacteria bacterium]